MKNVVVSLFVLLIILVSCKQEVKEELNYSEKLLLNPNNKIHLIKLNHGYDFIPNTHVTYIDLLILNDSTVVFNDSIYDAIDSTNLRGIYLKSISDKKVETFSLNCILPDLKRIIDSTVGEVQFNFFFDSSTTMLSLNRLYEDLSLNFTREKLKWINFFGRDNKYCQVNFIEMAKEYFIGGRFGFNRFIILINSSGSMMVESNWEADQDYLKQELINFYVNPQNSEMYPELTEINKELCLSNLEILRVKLSEYKSSKIEENIKHWEEYLQVTELVGEFKILPRSAFIHIQVDNHNPVPTYYNILDSIYGVINQLKSTASQSKFSKRYLELDSAHEQNQKKALDIIYQRRINETIIYPIPSLPKISDTFDFPTPPPPPKVTKGID